MPFTTLITAAELKQHIDNPTFVILDCRAELTDPKAGAAAFAAGHIPGAQHADADRDLSDKSPGPNGEFRGRHPLPAPEAFIETLRNWGVYPNSQVIAYDAHGSMFASRLWWMLRWVGHHGVAVLDGGLQAWQAAGGALERGPAQPVSACAFTPRPPLRPLVDTATVHARLGQPGQTVVDARGGPRFRGEVEPLDPVAGHIPGALNRPFTDNFAPDGRFKPAEVLRAEWLALLQGRAPETVVHQCGSGVSAVPNVIAMALAGLGTSALYAGSWSEWSRTAGLPCEKG